MSKLALAADFDARLPVERWPAIIVPAAEQPLLQQALGDGVAIYSAAGAARRGYVATARLTGFAPHDNGRSLTLSFDRMLRLPLLVKTIEPLQFRGYGPGRPVPESHRMLIAGDLAPLSEEAFAGIALNGGILHEVATAAPMAELSETAVEFTGENEERGRAFQGFRLELLNRYDHRCAFTGVLLAGAGATAYPHVVFFRPIELGGDLKIANAAPACEPAWSAMTRGDMTIGLRYEFIVALDRVRPELLDGSVDAPLNPAGRMRLPDDGDVIPDAGALAWHRDRVFNRD